MYITTNSEDRVYNRRFDWNGYFDKAQRDESLIQWDSGQILSVLRGRLQEDKHQMCLVMRNVIKSLLKDIAIHNPDILELAANTGFLTRSLVNELGGRGVLIDDNVTSYSAFEALDREIKRNIYYVVEDIFKLDIVDRFNIVCSFGLLEHFSDKRAVLGIHKKHVVPGGYVLVMVPIDTYLSRVFFEIYPELKMGYTELLTEKELRDALEENGLEVLRLEAGRGYVYDFAGVLCRVRE